MKKGGKQCLRTTIWRVNGQQYGETNRSVPVQRNGESWKNVLRYFITPAQNSHYDYVTIPSIAETVEIKMQIITTYSGIVQIIILYYKEMITPSIVLFFYIVEFSVLYNM